MRCENSNVFKDCLISDIKYNTFKKLSYDKSNKVYLVNSEENAIDFDAFKNTYNDKMKSDDAVYINNDNSICLIEFKNGRLQDYISDFNRKHTNDIIEKNNDSISILINTKVVSNDDIDSISYVFVYNVKKYPYETYKERFDIAFSSKSERLKNRLGLNVFNNMLKKSEVINNKEFDERYK